MNSITFVILCIEGAVLSFNVAASAALVPSISADFALSQFVAGKIVWLYMLPYGISALFYGPLVRLIDARKIELFCILFFSLANLLAGLCRNIYILFAARFLMGVFGASVIPLALILIARYIEDKRRGRFIGVFFSTTFFASLIGLFLSGMINWRLIYLIPAAAGFMLWIWMYFYLPSFSALKIHRATVNYAAVFRNKEIISVFTYIFFISLLYHGIQQWLAVYFSKDLGLGQFWVSMLVTLTSLSGIFGEILGGYLSDLFGRIMTINLGIILMFVSVFSLMLKVPVVFIALIMMIWGLGWTLNHAGISTLLTDLPKEFLNESASLNSSVRFISGGLGTAIGGIVMQRNFNLGFLTIGLLLVLTGIFSKRLLVVKQ